MMLHTFGVVAITTIAAATYIPQQCPISGKNDHGTTCITPAHCCSGRCRNSAYGGRACWCLEQNKICTYDGECCSYSCEYGRCTGGGYVFPTNPTAPPVSPTPPPVSPTPPPPTPPPPTPPPPTPPPPTNGGTCGYALDHGATCHSPGECCSNLCRRSGGNPGYCFCRNNNAQCTNDNQCCSYNCNHYTGKCEGGNPPPSPPPPHPTPPPPTPPPPTPPDCVDRNEYCGYWANTAMYCNDPTHGAYMQANCRLSCNFDNCAPPTAPPPPPAPSPPCFNPVSDACTNKGKPTSLTFEITGGPPLANVGQGDKGGSTGATLPATGPYTANCAIDDNSVASVTGNILTVSNFGGNDIVCDVSAGGLTQRISFHVSCSQPLFLGQDFGAMNLLTYIDSAGGTECNPVSGGGSTGMGSTGMGSTGMGM